MSKRIGVLLSGRGSNLEALAESAKAGRIPTLKSLSRSAITRARRELTAQENARFRRW